MPDIHIDEKMIAFISDWRKRSDEQQKRYGKFYLYVFIGVVLFCALSVFAFQRASYESIVERNMNYIQDSAMQETNQVERELDHAKNAVKTLATRYLILHQFHVTETKEATLTILKDKNTFDRIAYVAPDGMDTSLEGIADVSDRE